MKPNELINISHQEDIEIEPMIEIPKIHLIQEDYGPFKILEVHRVPIFMAILLKESNQCRIRLPYFYDIGYLKDILKQEMNSEEYSAIYPFIFELRDLIKYCYNVENIEEVNILLNEIKNVRYKKTNDGLKQIDARALNLNNLTAWELNEVKPFMLEVMAVTKKLES